jgi:hypothetical protein
MLSRVRNTFDTVLVAAMTSARHTVASASLHDGGGIFTLVWSLVVVPLSLAVIFNYRGLAERLPLRGGRRPMSPHAARMFAGVFLAAGILSILFAIHRFEQGGY